MNFRSYNQRNNSCIWLMCWGWCAGVATSSYWLMCWGWCAGIAMSSYWLMCWGGCAGIAMSSYWLMCWGGCAGIVDSVLAWQKAKTPDRKQTLEQQEHPIGLRQDRMHPNGSLDHVWIWNNMCQKLRTAKPCSTDHNRGFAWGFFANPLEIGDSDPL